MQEVKEQICNIKIDLDEFSKSLKVLDEIFSLLKVIKENQE